MNTDERVVVQFNHAINAQRLGDLARLMAQDHRFVDTDDNAVAGKDACLDAWAGFFSAFPDYRNEFDEVRGADGVVAVRGRSHCSEPELDGPALWSARVAGALVTEWRVYDDTVANRRALGFAEP